MQGPAAAVLVSAPPSKAAAQQRSCLRGALACRVSASPAPCLLPVLMCACPSNGSLFSISQYLDIPAAAGSGEDATPHWGYGKGEDWAAESDKWGECSSGEHQVLCAPMPCNRARTHARSRMLACACAHSFLALVPIHPHARSKTHCVAVSNQRPTKLLERFLGIGVGQAIPAIQARRHWPAGVCICLSVCVRVCVCVCVCA